ncbi:MAG TPA: hypothetical protein VMR00_03560 [Streptosporangiaceae bacterium]|jgi:hypothetical protein|nr:hypothetical protein [Streptosporangiaceae bacterium]
MTLGALCCQHQRAPQCICREPRYQPDLVPLRVGELLFLRPGNPHGADHGLPLALPVQGQRGSGRQSG